MARSLTPTDAYVIMNALVKQATGQQGVTASDFSSFVSAGETVLSTGVENTLNSLSIILGRTFMGVRPYKAKLALLDALNTGEYTSRVRKISFYARDNQPAGDWNTDINPHNLETGADNNSGTGRVASMWEQNSPVPLEMNFCGQEVWDTSTTVYENQLKVAFRSPEEFNSFVSGIMVEKGNDIERTKEAFNRMVLLNKIAGIYDLDTATPNGRVVNLTAAFNTKFGTAYTSAQLRSTYLTEFLEFFVAEIKKHSTYLTHSSTKYHYDPVKTIGTNTLHILRHTPKADQRLFLYQPLIIDAEARVLPQIFNDQYLKIDNYEGVDYWQAFTGDDSSAAISVTPAIPDASGHQVKGDPVDLDYVVGILYDKDGALTDFQFESANTTPPEARKRYRNIWYHFSKNAINDFTENGIIFIMKD